MSKESDSKNKSLFNLSGMNPLPVLHALWEAPVVGTLASGATLGALVFFGYRVMKEVNALSAVNVGPK